MSEKKHTCSKCLPDTTLQIAYKHNFRRMLIKYIFCILKNKPRLNVLSEAAYNVFYAQHYVVHKVSNVVC